VRRWRRLEGGQRHRLIDRQRLGQRLGRLGRAHAGHRVLQHQAVAPQPAVKAAPGRQLDGDAARRQPLRVQLAGPAAHVVRLHLAQRHITRAGQALQPRKGLRVHRQRARGEPPLDAQMLQVTHQVVVPPRGRGIGGAGGG
jgi:hypothetical protein